MCQRAHSEWGHVHVHSKKTHQKNPCGASLQAFLDNYLRFQLHCMRAGFSRALFAKAFVPKAYSTNKIKCW